MLIVEEEHDTIRQFVCNATACNEAPESPATLLVHLCPWGNPIYRHEKNLPGFDDAEQNLNIVEDVCKDLFLCDAEVYILVIGV